MPVAAAAEVFLELTTRSNPPVSPVDINTDLPPAIWRGEDVDFNVGIFDCFGNCVDLSNLQFLQVSILPAQLPAQASPGNLLYAPYSTLPYPSVPPAPLLSAVVPAAAITPVISRYNWLEGLESQATLSFSWIQTSSLNLGGQTEMDFWLVVQGLTSIGRMITYGGCVLKVHESGEVGIYLPNTTAPLDVPAATILLIEPNQQLLFAKTISIQGIVVIEGVLVQVNAITPPSGGDFNSDFNSDFTN
jgi:hypothetical protein